MSANEGIWADAIDLSALTETNNRYPAFDRLGRLPGLVELYRTCAITEVRDSILDLLDYALRYQIKNWEIWSDLSEFRKLLSDMCAKYHYDRIVSKMAASLLFRQKTYYNSEREELAKDIDLLVGLYEKSDSERSSSSGVAKVILNRILDENYPSDLYATVPSLKKLVESELLRIRPWYVKDAEKHSYLKEGWENGYRALRLIVAVQDRSFIPTIKKIVWAYESGLLRSVEDERSGVKIPETPAHEATFRAALKKLRARAR